MTARKNQSMPAFPATLVVYGHVVPAWEYETYKSVIDLLVGKSSVDVDLQRARDAAFEQAEVAFRRMRQL